MELILQLLSEAEAMMPQMVERRRDFHQHPELSFQEIRTAGIVAEHLENLGLEVMTGVGKTGVVAIIESDTLPPDARTVLLRFDMDALPIDELNDVDYRSQTPNVMHACGHDGHTTIGLAVADLLVKHREQLNGRVKIIFQPAEEILGGAMAMIRDGVLDDPIPDASFSMHLWTQLPLYQVVAQAGPLWAAVDMFELTVTGKGGHGAVPHETIDATIVACEIVNAWQTIVSRSVNPTDTAVLTVGYLKSGEVANAVSGSAKAGGTIRTFKAEVSQLVRARMDEIAAGICDAQGATYELLFPVSGPATVNSEEGAALMRTVGAEVVGADNVIRITPMMVSEDMSEILNRVPGCYVLVGASDPDVKWHSPHHNATFDFDERVMPTSAALMAGAAIEYLNK